jgi:hypothetical protein
VAADGTLRHIIQWNVRKHAATLSAYAPFVIEFMTRGVHEPYNKADGAADGNVFDAHHSRAISQGRYDVQQYDHKERKSRLPCQETHSSREVRCNESNDWKDHPVDLSMGSYERYQSRGD